MTSVNKEDVKRFWEQEACGERYGAEQDRLRYKLEPEILGFADFDSAVGKRVLEIGVGMGADFLRWVRVGAVATGVDLTERAVELTTQRLLGEGLQADIRVADAESLPFADDHFDIVYSARWPSIGNSRHWDARWLPASHPCIGKPKPIFFRVTTSWGSGDLGALASGAFAASGGHA